jgi:hypothetical protein
MIRIYPPFPVSKTTFLSINFQTGSEQGRISSAWTIPSPNYSQLLFQIDDILPNEMIVRKFGKPNWVRQIFKQALNRTEFHLPRPFHRVIIHR